MYFVLLLFNPLLWQIFEWAMDHLTPRESSLDSQFTANDCPQRKRKFVKQFSMDHFSFASHNVYFKALPPVLYVKIDNSMSAML